jgi:lipopolysaccharide export system protein LptA
MSRFFLTFPIFFFLISAGLFSDNISFSGDFMQADLAEGRERTVLTGNAYLKSNDFVIYADRIELYGEDFIFAECSGNILVINEKKGITITCEKLFYNRRDEILRLENNAVMEDTENEIIIKGGLIENRDKEDITIIQIGVRILKEDMVCRSQLARYFREEQRLELYGLPEVIWKDDQYEATRIFVDLENDEVTLEGDVSAEVIYTKEEEEEEGAIEEEEMEEEIEEETTLEEMIEEEKEIEEE